MRLSTSDKRVRKAWIDGVEEDEDWDGRGKVCGAGDEG